MEVFDVTHFGSKFNVFRRFFRSENFVGWLKQRQKEVNHKLQLLHLEILCNSVRILDSFFVGDSIFLPFSNF